MTFQLEGAKFDTMTMGYVRIRGSIDTYTKSMVIVVKSIVNRQKLSVQCEKNVLIWNPNQKCIFIPKHELEISTSLSGEWWTARKQTNTKVVLRWNIKESLVVTEFQRNLLLKNLNLTVGGELVIHSDESRSQRQNINNALDKCKHRVEQALVIPKRKKLQSQREVPKKKRVERKKQRSELKKKQNRRKPDIP